MVTVTINFEVMAPVTEMDNTRFGLRKRFGYGIYYAP
jgi:hypothetical protein